MHQQAPTRHPQKLPQKLHYFHKEPYSLFLYYSQGHPINIKDRFLIGHMKIFTPSHMFVRELYSTDHLNAAVEWDHRFFYCLVEGFGGFQVRGRQDADDLGLDFYVRGEVQPGHNEILLKATLQPEFGISIQKQFWKQFQAYTKTKSLQISDQQSQIKQIQAQSAQKLQQIKKYCDEAEKDKKMLLGRLSAIMTEKVNKLKEYEDDYCIQLLEEKFRKAREGKEGGEGDARVMSSYQEGVEYGATLFQPSQEFRN